MKRQRWPMRSASAKGVAVSGACCWPSGRSWWGRSSTLIPLPRLTGEVDKKRAEVDELVRQHDPKPLGDLLEHDLRRAAADRLDARVARHAFDRRLPHAPQA